MSLELTRKELTAVRHMETTRMDRKEAKRETECGLYVDAGLVMARVRAFLRRKDRCPKCYEEIKRLS